MLPPLVKTPGNSSPRGSKNADLEMTTVLVSTNGRVSPIQSHVGQNDTAAVNVVTMPQLVPLSPTLETAQQRRSLEAQLAATSITIQQTRSYPGPADAASTEFRGRRASISVGNAGLLPVAARARRWTLGASDSVPIIIPNLPPESLSPSAGPQNTSPTQSTTGISAASTRSLLMSDSAKSLTLKSPANRRKSCAGELLYKCDKIRDSEKGMIGLMGEIETIVEKMGSQLQQQTEMAEFEAKLAKLSGIRRAD
eukprot:Opistho-2@75915